MLVRDFMSYNPKTLKVSDTIKDVANLFYKYKVDVAPVVDKMDALCGLVTRTNILEALVNDLAMSCSVDKIMTKGVILIHPDNTLDEAWQIPVNHLPVVDYQNKIVGMLNRCVFTDIFYHRMCKTANRASELIKTSYDGIIIVNWYGIIKEINQIAGRLIGIKPEEAKGRFIYDIVPNSKLMQVIEKGEKDLNNSIEINGQRLTVNRSPICEDYKVVGAVSVLKDVSLQDDLVERLKVNERKVEALECILESLKQGIIVVDTKNVINFVNHSYEDVMGIAREDLIGHTADSTIENSRMHIVLKTGVPELAELQRVKGRQVVVNRVPMFKDGTIIGAIGEAVFKDIREVDMLIERGKNMTRGFSLERVRNNKNAEKLITFENIIGRSRNIVHVKNLAAKVALTDTTVLIQGESGTGKDLFAQAIHNNSNRRNKSLVSINCAAIPSDLLEAELFGYDEGAFTGAKKGGKKGKFEIAEGGTLFLDEIGDMPLPMQAKLLRVMQNKTFEHVGGERQIYCDVRIIAATNKNLQDMVRNGLFREDLYYRLNVVCLEVPALRERQEDIGELVEMLMPGICHTLGVPVKHFSPEALALLRSYHWQGNVRELINVLEQIGATVSSMLITPKQLPGSVVKQTAYCAKTAVKDVGDEAKHIEDVLREARGNKALAAKILGIHRSTLYEKIKKYNLR